MEKSCFGQVEKLETNWELSNREKGEDRKFFSFPQTHKKKYPQN